MNILRLRILFIRTLRLKFARKFKKMCGLNYEYAQTQTLLLGAGRRRVKVLPPFFLIICRVLNFLSGYKA